MIYVDMLVLAAGAGIGIVALFFAALGFDVAEKLYERWKRR